MIVGEGWRRVLFFIYLFIFITELIIFCNSPGALRF